MSTSLYIASTMDKYKKKSLKFMGFSRDLRNEERNSKRALSRLQRFSLLRPVSDDEDQKSIKEGSSKIPMFGKPKAPAVIRVEMLQKWKQEKMLKKQQESKLKKPAFKVGGIEHKPPPVLDSKSLFAVDMTSSRSFKSRMQISQFQSEKNQSKLVKDPNTSNTSHMIVGNKISHLQPQSKLVQKPGNSNTLKMVPNSKSLKLPSTNSKAAMPNTFQSKLVKNKQDQSSITKRQPVPTSKLKEPTKESHFQSSSTKPKIDYTVPNDVKSKISSGLRKPTNSRILNKVSEQTHQTAIPKKNTSRTVDAKSNQKGIPVKSNIAKNIPAKSSAVSSKLKGSVLENANKNEKKTIESKKKELKNPVKEDSDISLVSDPKNITFRSELSTIEPVANVRKSFAPDGFIFRPPIELNCSLFLEDGPSSIFTRIKNEYERTSTPKQNAIKQWQNLEKDIEDDNEFIKKKGDEDTSILSSAVNSVLIKDNEALEHHPAQSENDGEEAASFSYQESNFVTDSDPSQENKLEEAENAFHFIPLEKAEAETPSKIDQCATEIAELPINEAVNPYDLEQLENIENDKSLSNGSVKNNLTSNFELRTRNFRRSEKPALESINESLETTEKFPNSSKKKSVLNTDFTPRRSLRLAKLSCESDSAETLLDVKKPVLFGTPTPRRSLRLAKHSCESSSPENLLNVRRPTLFGTPEVFSDEKISKRSGLTYDFERLELEDSSLFRSAHPRKVSLLYTPPQKGEPSMSKKSINGNLISFSPAS
ncbi:uncharacterized protein NPIL_445171 [Nephila pilipes]|uniref:Uncharacterized protein n=1 Tax=Nephila pilipes TaxID=299642 RepID=A0A8X6UJZ5_NEPPI|nr:uncharacterized protein NPIL_445171 [Nephila pilipes]